ncbi:TTC28 [Symbiodinium pilosum]|uniref:TTC28 protein n=1 Tax=Symbiodinium pilosum TaxID=2952 RepID=A0A812THB9_SYMPI|nr:TTC28 [Symbiodinium pilosum]
MQANGEEEKAASVAEEELMMAKKVGDRRREAYAQMKMAQAMITQDRPRDATRRATEAAERLREMGDLKGEAKATQLLVELQCQARRAMEASRTAKEAQRLFKEAGDMKGCIGVLQLLTSLHLEAGDPHSAIQAARDQVKLFREAGYKEEEASATLGLAEMTQQTMGPRDALRLSKDAASMFSSAGDLAGEARALAQVAQMHLGLKANSNAMQTAKQAEELARRSGDEKVLITALQAVGEAYSSADRFTEGIDAAKEALQMVEKAPVNDDTARAAALACMANVQLQVAHYDVNNPGARIRPRGLKEALKAAEEALALHRKIGDRNGEINGIQRIFHAHLLSQDGPNSLRYAREYVDLAQSTEQKENLGSALVSLCQGHFLCRNWEEAERANLEARAIFEKARMHENIEVCDQIMREMKQEMERDRRPSQPMGRANATQGAGSGYNSLLPERQTSRMQQDGQGVPSGGFRSGVPAGGFGNSESTQISQSSQPPRSAAATEKTAKGFSDGLRGAFSKDTKSGAGAPERAKPNGAYTPGATSGNGFTGHSAPSASTGSRSGAGSGFGGRSSGYGESSSRYGGSGVGSNYGSNRGVPAGGFGKSGVPVWVAVEAASAPVQACPRLVDQVTAQLLCYPMPSHQAMNGSDAGDQAAPPSPALPAHEASVEAKNELPDPYGVPTCLLEEAWAITAMAEEAAGSAMTVALEAVFTLPSLERKMRTLSEMQRGQPFSGFTPRWRSTASALSCCLYDLPTQADKGTTVLIAALFQVDGAEGELLNPQAYFEPGELAAISRAKEVVRDLEAEASAIDMTDVSQAGGMGLHEVLSQSLKETQRQCDSLNREMDTSFRIRFTQEMHEAFADEETREARRRQYLAIEALGLEPPNFMRRAPETGRTEAWQELALRLLNDIQAQPYSLYRAFPVARFSTPQTKVQQAESNEKLVESMGGVKAESPFETHCSQSAEIAQMMQQRVADEERLGAACRRHEGQREASRHSLQQQVVSVRDAGAERQWQVQRRLSDKLQKLEYGSVNLRTGVGQLGQDLQDRQQAVAELFREVSAWWQVWQKDIPTQLLQPFQKKREQKVEIEHRIGPLRAGNAKGWGPTLKWEMGAFAGGICQERVRGADGNCSNTTETWLGHIERPDTAMGREDLGSASEDAPPKKQRREEPAPAEVGQSPARTIEVRVRSISGEVLLTLPRADRCWTVMRLKGLVEAALNRPRCTQRLLLQNEDLEEVNQDFRSLAGLLPEGAVVLDLTLLKQDAPDRALYDEAKAGRGGTCLALLQLPDRGRYLNYLDAASQQSCLHMAAAMRLGAACLSIAASPEFEHINVIDRRRNWSVLHWAVFSSLPDVCVEILSRKDFTQGGHRDNGGETALDRAIEAGYRDCIFAMVPLLSTKDLLSLPLPMPVLINPNDISRINKIAHGDKDIAEAIQETLAKRKKSEGW